MITTEQAAPGKDRRWLLQRVPSAIMAIGLSLGYGAFATFVARFLFPAREAQKLWQYVTDLASVSPGASLTYVAPAGQKIVVTRIAERGEVEDFIALSSVCPHLGCQVHWESQNNRFFCPCHNGAFDATGKAIAGPPQEARQSLARYPLKIEHGLLFIEAPAQSLVQME